MKKQITTLVLTGLFATASYAVSDQELSEALDRTGYGETYTSFVTSNHDVHPLSQVKDGPSIVAVANDLSYFGSLDPVGTAPSIQQGTGEEDGADVLVHLGILPR